MTKCDFCTQSDSNSKCPWSSIVYKQKYCDKAIKQMVKALGNNKQDKHRGKIFG